MLILLAILELGVLIIIHEGGHFLVARLSGMRVDRFSIGFGPALLKFKRGETTYQISAIPLGGFVQIAGLNPGDDSLAADDKRSYPNRPVYQRLLTIFAGPGTNYLFAAIMMAIIFAGWGVPVPGKLPIVTELMEGRPAAAAGIQPGDEIVSINGKTVSDTNDVSNIIDGSQGQPVTLVVTRETENKTFTVKPEKDAASGKFRIGIGIHPKSIRERQPIGPSIVAGLAWPYDFSVDILHGLSEIIHGRQKAEFTGPVGIVKVMKGQIAKGTDSALQIMAMISVYLGLFNLLPLPALDGGRLVFLLYEGLSRRRVNQRFETLVHTAGMVVLLLFMAYVTFGHDLGINKYFSH